MGAVGQLAVNVSANLKGFLSGMQTVTTTIKSVKQRFGEESVLGQFGKALRGGGAVAGISAVANSLDNLTERVANFSDTVNASGWAAGFRSLASGLPIVGALVRRFDDLAAAASKAAESSKAAADAQRKALSSLAEGTARTDRERVNLGRGRTGLDLEGIRADASERQVKLETDRTSATAAALKTRGAIGKMIEGLLPTSPMMADLANKAAADVVNSRVQAINAAAAEGRRAIDQFSGEATAKRLREAGEQLGGAIAKLGETVFENSTRAIRNADDAAERAASATRQRTKDTLSKDTGLIFFDEAEKFAKRVRPGRKADDLGSLNVGAFGNATAGIAPAGFNAGVLAPRGLIVAEGEKILKQQLEVDKRQLAELQAGNKILRDALGAAP